MKIQDINSSIRTLTTVQEREQSNTTARPAVREKSEDGDSAELRVQLGRHSVTNNVNSLVSENYKLNSDKRAEISQRIASGFYDSVAATDKIANNIADFYQPTAQI